MFCFIGSKNNNGPAPTSGFAGGKSNQIPCYHNGKLATPQSLIPKKTNSNITKSNKKNDGVAIPQAIDEDLVSGLKKTSSSHDAGKSTSSMGMKGSSNR